MKSQELFCYISCFDCEKCGHAPDPVFLSPLSELSVNGEKLVDEEVRRALYGVTQMKEVMRRNEQKHEHLMKSLKHSSDRKNVRPPLA